MFLRHTLTLWGLFATALGSASRGTGKTSDSGRDSGSDSGSDSDVFDYVVVGSGPGGGPLAVNLAEAGYSVLLLEAGQNHSSSYKQEIPAFFVEAQFDESQGWWFYVKHYGDEATSARVNKMVWKKPDGGLWVGQDAPAGSSMLGVWYPRAGTLGGCDTHNGGVTVYPSEWDWEAIAQRTNDSSWKAQHMRHYFERLERNMLVPPHTPGHGFAGYQPIDVGAKEHYEAEPQMLAIAQASAAALGFTQRSTSTDWDVILNKDSNAYTPDRDRRNDAYQISLKKDHKGRRFSAASRVNQAVARGLPLTVRFNSLVTRVVIDDASKRATGVDYLEGAHLYRADPLVRTNSTGLPRSVRASREVIVSGGTFNTPQILQLSGIGPRQELQRLGIPVIVDLGGVGRNLQDHYEVPVVHEFRNDFTYWDRCDPYNHSSACFQEWRNEGKGPYTTIGFSHLVTHTSSVAPRGERDLILYGAPNTVRGHLPPYTHWPRFQTGNNKFTFTVSESHSRNRAGRVTLTSTDPRDVPDINFEYFAHGAQDDMQGLMDGVAFARNIFDSIPARNRSVAEAWPGRHLSSPDSMRDWIKEEAYGHHATGTASIGAHDDPLAVLDSDFRVRGIDGLRVVDASVFPDVPGTFPIIAIFMVSEKASHVILADARRHDLGQIQNLL
ncbi:hypothetical protein CDD81_1228 [Ophiocordyceps australis]|uniref:Glucose-methanol-choline oxidoreductase N-terminal domain-containing protein n=1 Tax=Ophiocordyceps australis TaxID=1399860 RepID=A0A2C5XBA8_9HYPO|nr:hypothetical protein CDD81_1228 [Ophiocordyceps australis]